MTETDLPILKKKLPFGYYLNLTWPHWVSLPANVTSCTEATLLWKCPILGILQGKTFPFLRPKTRGNEFQKLAIWGTIFVGAKRSVELKSSKSAKFWLSKSIFYVKNDTNLFKAELLQLNHTQFPSLRIFVGKKSWKSKKLGPPWNPSLKSCILDGLTFFDFQLF